LELLPSRQFNPTELGEFNRRWTLITEQVRDLTALLGTAVEGGTELPDSLATRIDQYRYRGRLPYQEDEVLSRDDWTSALIGMGIIPEHVDPSAAGVPLDQATEAMEKLARELAEFTAGAPAYPEYLARITPPR
jgi:tryptophan halogenase